MGLLSWPRVFDISRETSGQLAEVSDGFWLLSTRHRGGGFSLFPEVDNRAFVLQLTDSHHGREVLVVINATDPQQSFAQLDELSRQLGIPVAYVLSCGGAHHGYLAAWHGHYPKAQVLLSDERIPKTRNGKKLMQLQRVSTFDAHDPLPMFRHQLAAHSFTGLLGAREYPSPSDGDANSFVRAAAAMWQLARPTDHYDQLWLFHRASATTIAGENLAPYYSAAAHARLGWLLRQTLPCEQLKLATAIWDRDAVTRGWQTITRWKARQLLGVHDAVGSCFSGDVATALRKLATKAGQLGDQQAHDSNPN